MPSYMHELLIDLFRHHASSATDLLSQLDVPLPEYDEVLTGSSDISDLKPAEYRADLVLFLVRESQNVLVVAFVFDAAHVPPAVDSAIGRVLAQGKPFIAARPRVSFHT